MDCKTPIQSTANPLRKYLKEHTVCERMLDRWGVTVTKAIPQRIKFPIQAPPSSQNTSPFTSTLKFYWRSDVENELGVDLTTIEKRHEEAKIAKKELMRLANVAKLENKLAQQPIHVQNARFLKAHTIHLESLRLTPIYLKLINRTTPRNTRVTEDNWMNHKEQMLADIDGQRNNRDWLRSFIVSEAGEHHYQLGYNYRDFLSGEASCMDWLESGEFQRQVRLYYANLVAKQEKINYLMTINCGLVYRKFTENTRESETKPMVEFNREVDAYVAELNEDRMKLEWIGCFRCNFQRKPFPTSKRCSCHLAIVCPKSVHKPIHIPRMQESIEEPQPISSLRQNIASVESAFVRIVGLRAYGMVFC